MCICFLMCTIWRQKQDFEMRPANSLNHMIVTLNFHWPELADNKAFGQQLVQSPCENTFFTGLPDEGKPLWIINVAVWLLNMSWWKSIWEAFVRGETGFPGGQLDLKHSLWAQTKTNFHHTSVSIILEVAVCAFSTASVCVTTYIGFSLRVSYNTFEKKTRFSKVKTLKLLRLKMALLHRQWLEQSEISVDLELMSLHSPPLLIKSLILFINWNNNRNQTPGNVCQGC